MINTLTWRAQLASLLVNEVKSLIVGMLVGWLCFAPLALCCFFVSQLLSLNLLSLRDVASGFAQFVASGFAQFVENFFVEMATK